MVSKVMVANQSLQPTCGKRPPQAAELYVVHMNKNGVNVKRNVYSAIRMLEYGSIAFPARDIARANVAAKTQVRFAFFTNGKPHCLQSLGVNKSC